MPKRPTRNLRPSRSDLQSALDAIAKGLCGLDATGKVTFCNDAFLKMTGYDSEEIAGEYLHDLLHRCPSAAGTHAHPGCALRNATESAEPVHTGSELFYRKDGTSFRAECWLRPLAQSSGSTTSLLTVRDNSAHLQAQKAKERRNAYLQKILANVPDVAWTTDQTGHTIYISPKVESVLGYSVEEICASGPSLWLGRIHPEDIERVARAFGALFKERGLFDEEYRIRRKDESWIWVHDRATVTREEDGTLYADGIFSDVTRRKQAEVELLAKTAFLEAQANCTIDGMLVLGLENQRILLNQRLIQLFTGEGALLKQLLTALVDYAEVVLVKIGIVAIDFDHLGNKASARSPFELNDNIHRIPDVGLDGSIG